MKVKQRDIMDCGAACLASIAAHYKLHIPVAKIRQYASTDKRGTNVLGMIQAAEKMGFTAKGVRGGLDSLAQVPLPTIAHVILKSEMGELHHYVVITKVGKDSIKVMDPAYGEYKDYSLAEFEKLWSGVLILLVPSDNFVAYKETTSPMKRFFDLVQPHKTILFQALFGAVVYTMLGLCMAKFIEKITDYVLPSGNLNLLNLMGVAMVLILILQTFIGANKSLLVLKTGQLIDAKLILGYYKHLLSLPQRFFDTMQVGEIISRINDAVKIRAFINDIAIDMIVNCFIVLFSFILMFTYSWKLALIVGISLPIYVLIYYVMNKLNKKQERKVMEQSAILESQLVESINIVKTIKQFGIEKPTNEKTESKFIGLLYKVYDSALNSFGSGFSTQFVSQLFTVILLWKGSHFVVNQEITAGELFSFYALMGYFTGPFSSLINANKSIQNALIAANRLFEIMDLEMEKRDTHLELTREELGDIEFENVDFCYGSREDIFEDLNLTLEKGKVSAIVGESGSGKSTLLYLLQNLYPIKGGKIMINGIDINDYSLDSIRKIIGVVPQNIDLISGNVFENVALGEQEVDYKKVYKLIEDVGLKEFVEKLPNGFDTYLDENGAMLSGGQKQKFAIARALYKNPEILILDEATSSLDAFSELTIQRTLDNLKLKGKTIIIIAHRLSTIKFADCIFVLEKGKLVESGTHDELILNKNMYSSLVHSQNS